MVRRVLVINLLAALLAGLAPRAAADDKKEPVVLAMIPYKEGVLTAFSNCEGKPGLYRVHFSKDGQKPGEGEIVYEGISPVTAMVEFEGGVLTAFTNCGGKSDCCRAHFSKDGKNLGEGEVRYEGLSPVTTMTVYKGGVLTAFSNCEGKADLHRIHWSKDGTNLGGGEIRFEQLIGQPPGAKQKDPSTPPVKEASKWPGEWLLEGKEDQPCAIFQQGRVLLLVNERGEFTTGNITAENKIVTRWEDGLVGELDEKGKTISWGNGTTWKRP
jgi:hypothetical protein